VAFCATLEALALGVAQHALKYFPVGCWRIEVFEAERTPSNAVDAVRRHALDGEQVFPQASESIVDDFCSPGGFVRERCVF
jgi:hypothetical protein